jgi:MSHA pilin protein MshD
MSVRRARGVTLVELVVFIVVVGLAVAGIFTAFNTLVAGSASPEVRKQALAIAESLLEEIQQMAFTYCDANDPQAATATNSGIGATGCQTYSQDLAPFGPKTIGGTPETRYSTTLPFNNVMHYNGFSMPSGIYDITSGGLTQVPGLGGYSASVAVSQVNLASGADQISSPEALKIAVTVTGPGGVSVALEGYRTRYAPTTIP